MTYKIAWRHRGTFFASDLEENKKILVLPAERERERGETFPAAETGGGAEETGGPGELGDGAGEPWGGAEDDGAVGRGRDSLRQIRGGDSLR
jgi:hypothetical protein